MCLLYFFPDMRKDVQEIYRNTPHGKQVMMFSATLRKEIRPVCKKFMQDVIQLTTPYSTTTTTSTQMSYGYHHAPNRNAAAIRERG